MIHTEIALPLKVVEKKPVDSKFICQDMAEALSLSYPGYICFIAATGKFYRFLSNNTPHEWQVFNIEDFATRAELQTEIAKLVNSSPEVLDTLAEIAAALNNDQNFAQTMVNELVKKVDKVPGMGLSENNYTTTEKTKLAGLQNYMHPANHPASIITQDSNNRFVSDTEKTTWNGKASTAVATTGANGLMSNTDKSKLDGVAAGANNYTHPANHPASIITQDANNRFVTDTEKTNWNGKASTSIATQSANGLMSKEDKTKLDNMSPGTGGTYEHPASHPAYMIEESIDKQFASNEEKEFWNRKAENRLSEAIVLDQIESTVRYPGCDGLMSAADKTKLDGVEVGANNYSHPANHPASIISQDANNRFVTDTEKATWNGKASTAVATTGANGLMSNTDKSKLDGVAAGANNYTHPANHPASIITQDASNRFVSDTEKTTWNNKASTAVATTGANGLMSNTDKSKLDGVAAGANNYTHPANHPASIITQDASNRFVSDTEKATWNDKYTKNETDNKLSALVTALDWKEAVANFAALATTYPAPEQGWTVNVKDVNKTYTFNGTAWIQTGGNTPLATQSVDGLMSSTDKSKLDGVAAGANNYSHPANHPASIITQDANNRFVTDTEKTNWNGKASTSVATTGANGLMSSTDKSKLDGVAAGANNYSHPANHPASIITQDASNRFVTDTEKTNWNGKASTALATTSANGLMSSTDKSKLDGVASGANNYTHPANHPASIITQDASNRFVTDTEKTTWNAKPTVTVSSIQPAGAKAGDIWIKP
jgi:hypothetical protein